MSPSRVRLAFHEAGHALVGLAQGRQLERVWIDESGGAVEQQPPLEPDASAEEIEAGLVMVLAGAEAERYAPVAPLAPASNGTGDPYAGLAAAPDGRPSDEAVVEHYSEQIGEEAVERARALAAELVARKHAIGQLEQLADELMWRGALTGVEVARLLARSRPRGGRTTPRRWPVRDPERSGRIVGRSLRRSERSRRGRGLLPLAPRRLLVFGR